MSVSDTAVAVAAARPLGAPLVRDAAPADYAWSSIITGIVQSSPFGMAVASGEAAASRTGKARE